MSEADRPREELLHRFLESYGLRQLGLQDLDLALTHRSYAYEVGLGADNERLEFLGDAIIGAVTSEYLYEHDPLANEGVLSKRRSHLVSRLLLGVRAIEMGFGELMLLGRGERETGGTRRRSTLGSALEALVGVIYLRLGFDAARDFIGSHILAVLTQPETAAQAQDYKSMLQEWTQQQYKMVPVYSRLSEAGPDHDKQFSVQVAIAGQVLAQASGPRVKVAENEAARLALQAIKAGQANLPQV